MCFQIRFITYLEFIQWKDFGTGSETINPRSQSENAEVLESEDAHLLAEDNNDEGPVQPRKKVRVATKKRILESSEDDNERTPSSPVQPRKKVRNRSKKKHHRSPSIEELEVDNDFEDIRPKNNNKKCTGQTKNSSNTRKDSDSDDSDIQVIEKPKESPEKELGI